MFVIGSVIACLLHPVNSPTTLSKWEPMVRQESCVRHVSPRIVMAIMAKESSGDRWAKNGSAVGLMQIKVATARMLGYKGPEQTLYKPNINIYYGVKYLAKLLKRYRYGWDIVSAYNCGTPHWRRGIGFTCLGHKTNYVSSVARVYHHLRYKPLSRRLAMLASNTVYAPFSEIVPRRQHG